MKPTPKTGNIKFAPSALARFGEELVPSAAHGLIELLKNSYDADATKCSIILRDTAFAGGKVEIEDDGEGMDGDTLLNNFLLIGGSEKQGKSETNTKKRLLVGEKGLGRLAALRLGHEAIIRSRPISEPKSEYVLTIDWKAFENAKTVEEVPIHITKRHTNKVHGTDIEIRHLKKPLSDNDVKLLTRETLLLSEPMSFLSSDKIRISKELGKTLESFSTLGNDTFIATISAEGYNEMQEKLKSGYLNDAGFRLEAECHENGSGTFRLFDQSNILVGAKDFKAGHFSHPSLTFVLWVFGRSERSDFSPKSYTAKEINPWLDRVGGIHFYHRKIKVRPYGDKGDDWLGLNLERSRHQENTPSTNQVYGFVSVEDRKGELKQQTNRIGFIEGGVFLSIRETCKLALRFMYNERKVISDVRREARRREESNQKEKVLREAAARVSHIVAPKKANEVMKVIKDVVDKEEMLVKSIKADLQLYRSLGTIGTTFALYAHDVEQPLTSIASFSQTIQDRGEEYFRDLYIEHLKEVVECINDSAQSAMSYTEFPLQHLQRSKRVTGAISVVDSWQETVRLLSPITARSGTAVSVDSQVEDGKSKIFGSIALVEAIAANLISNSLKALTDVHPTRRQISIAFANDGKTITISHADNGKGISDDEIRFIWNAGYSGTEGTGFGLTIVKDSVSDLGGQIEVLGTGRLGGAEFVVRLPVAEEK